MASKNDDLGARGEELVSSCLRTPSSAHNNRIRFRPKFLGEKSELLDFLVLLVDEQSQAFGPHFFLQVKTTATTPKEDAKSIVTEFTAEEVSKALALKTPVYLVAVDASKPYSESIYVMGIGASRIKGISAIPKSLSLKDPAIRETLYEEVKDHFQARNFAFKSKVVRHDVDLQIEDEA